MRDLLSQEGARRTCPNGKFIQIGRRPPTTRTAYVPNARRVGGAIFIARVKPSPERLPINSMLFALDDADVAAELELPARTDTLRIMRELGTPSPLSGMVNVSVRPLWRTDPFGSGERSRHLAC
jgi:hypothetical protein